MSLNRFLGKNWLACLLVSLHSLLIVLWAWIELDNAWNDMNPTMIVMAALYVIDYPINQLLTYLVSPTTQTGTYLAALLLFGGVFWFAVGSFFAAIGRRLGRAAIWRHVPKVTS